MGASSRYRGDRWGEGMWEMHTRGQYWAVWNGNVWEGWGSVGVQHCCGGALMLQLTEAEPSPSCLRKWTTLRWPLFWALSRHVSPCLFLSCLLSPKWEHKYFTVSRWPLPAARWRALSPDYINRREQQKGIGQPHSYVHASYVWYTSQAICTLTVIFFFLLILHHQMPLTLPTSVKVQLCLFTRISTISWCPVHAASNMGERPN